MFITYITFDWTNKFCESDTYCFSDTQILIAFTVTNL